MKKSTIDLSELDHMLPQKKDQMIPLSEVERIMTWWLDIGLAMNAGNSDIAQSLKAYKRLVMAELSGDVTVWNPVKK